jgi:ATP-dependent DNA helicase DinG
MDSSISRLPVIEIGGALPGASKSEAYRHLFGLALKFGDAPEKIDCADLPRMAIRLSPAAKAKLLHVAGMHDLTAGEAFAGMCAAGLARINNAGRAKKVATRGRKFELPFEPQSDQQRAYYDNIMAGLRDRRIVFAEASTGIGKSRVLAAAALGMAQQQKTPVIIAAPSVAIMEHLYREWLTLESGEITAVIMPGAAEFVDDAALRCYIAAADMLGEELEVDEVVRAWVAGGAKPLDPDSPIAHAIGEDAAWLLSDLRRLAINMPVDDFVLRGVDDSGGEAQDILRAVRARAQTDADVIFCTHAMLALSQKLNWTLLPEPCVVMIDEAHQFESAVARMNSEQISMYSLRVSLSKARKGKGKNNAAAKAIAEARKLTDLLKSMADDAATTICLTTMGKENLDGLGVPALIHSLAEKLSVKSLDSVPDIGRFRAGLRSAMNAIRVNTASNRVDLAFSPDRRYPSLYSGPSRMDRAMRGIWDAAKGGVVLASATLYTLDANGNSKCDYLRGILAVDHARLSAPPPVVSKSIYTIPVLQVPSPRAASGLIPPSRQSENPDWHRHVAQAITHAAGNAKGGTLVLLTAYRDIHEVSTILRGNGMDDRIIEMRQGVRFSETERQFRAAHAAGLRPVLLGLGVAWTGIDLKDSAVPADRDTLLTDLIVARLPVALNRTNAMLARIERTGMNPVISEALLMLKQGMGRLIRRDGVTDRRIWILDGRMFPPNEWRGMRPLTSAARRMLREYRKQKVFDFD